MKDSYLKNNSTKSLNSSTILLIRHINYFSHFNHSFNYNKVLNVFNSKINFESKIFYTTTKIKTVDSESNLVTEFEIIDTFLKNIKLVKDSLNITTILDCPNFYLEKERLAFRKSLNKASGIYMLKCKLDSRLFYIGQAVNLSNRLGSHFTRTELETTKLGNMIKLIGWNKFSVHILEYCEEEELISRENYYIEKYLPTLNGRFSSHYSNKIHRTLRSILKHIQLKNRRYEPISISTQNNELSVDTYLKFKSKMWIYQQISDCQINLINNRPFENLRQAQNILNIDARTIDIYADTYIPYKDFFFFTKEMKDTSIIINRSRELNTIGISNYLPKQIWTYSSDTLSLVNNRPFNTIKEASLFIGTSRSTIINILDRNIAMSKGFYCFTRELNEIEKIELKEKGIIRSKISSLSIPVWVYTLQNNNLILVNNRPFQSQQEMLKVLNLKRVRTINKYKDTGINFKGYYFFSQILSSEELERLKTNTLYAKSNRKSILV